MSAFFVVRAQVVDPSMKEAFDKWYQDEHLPDAMKAFGAKARAVPGSEAIKPLIAEFDRLWGKKVLRTREVVRVVQRIGS